MSKLPTDLSGRDLVKALQKVGFVVQRQRGSHRLAPRFTACARQVPDHKSIRIGTLRTILREADLTVEQLLELI